MVFKLLQNSRQSAATLLLVLLVFQGCGWLATWLVVRQEARRQARAVCTQPRTRLSAVTLPASAYRHLRFSGHEVWLNGHLYDIRNVREQQDSIHLTLYHDAREEALYAALADMLAPAFHRRACGTAPTQVALRFFSWSGSFFLAPQPLALPRRPRQVIGQPDFGRVPVPESLRFPPLVPPPQVSQA